MYSSRATQMSLMSQISSPRCLFSAPATRARSPSTPGATARSSTRTRRTAGRAWARRARGSATPCTCGPSPGTRRWARPQSWSVRGGARGGRRDVAALAPHARRFAPPRFRLGLEVQRHRVLRVGTGHRGRVPLEGPHGKVRRLCSGVARDRSAPCRPSLNGRVSSATCGHAGSGS